MTSAIYDSYKVDVANKETVKAIPSYEVAAMMGSEHKNLLRMIEGGADRVGIIEVLTKAQMEPSKYFIESTYRPEGGKKDYKCYECTKLGCDMLANKMTGEKGILFTAKYVSKFNEMQSMIQEQQPKLPSNYKEALQQLLVQVEEKEELEKKLEQNSKMIRQIEASKNSLLVREVAKILSNKHSIVIGEKRLYNKLREWGWVFKKSTEATQEAIRTGYLEVRETFYETSSGPHATHVTRVTGKGQRKILEKLLIEMEVTTNE